ncbi:uncharacterized protein C15orf41 homolog [Galendromus occidentalis]|uniref:CDAN1-interacting nuclease 1 n=1 Tax=Galendromus occidentalis TaxID=34638 RepID=A0AAJ6QQ38_9ACAR|nr:uncharacterized protein C15orf41 homolog [Galendromus occidentalis]
MKMLLAEYEAIAARHSQLPVRKSLDVLLKEFAHVPGHVLRSIVSGCFVRWVRKNHHRFSSVTSRAMYYGHFKERSKSPRPGFLLEMADQMKFSPSLLCRLILENYLTEIGDPQGKKRITNLLKDSSLIRDKVLAFEVFYCTINDPFYGPYNDAKKEISGQENEIRLKDFLREKNIAFLDENDLRDQGFDKTVDVKLSVPAVINGENIIMWIESKSAFGDPKTHAECTREQYHSYVNRFGPGLVIYWSGFVDELQHCPENQIGNSIVYLADSPPEDIRSMIDLV